MKEKEKKLTRILRIFMMLLTCILIALFFGIMKTLAYTYTAIPFLSALGFPSVVYKLIPYVATLILLAFTSKNSAAPKASGIPYDKSKR